MADENGTPLQALSTKPSMTEMLREMLAEGLSPDAASAKAVEGADREELAAMALPLVCLRARQIQRQTTRRVEEQVERQLAHGEDPVSVREQLSAHYFPLPPPHSRYVLWLEATAEEHLLRAGWQRKHASACLSDAVRHEEAADQIEAAGVKCLADLEPAAETAGAA